MCDLETSRIGALSLSLSLSLYIYIYIYDISSLRVNWLMIRTRHGICERCSEPVEFKEADNFIEFRRQTESEFWPLQTRCMRGVEGWAEGGIMPVKYPVVR